MPQLCKESKEHTAKIADILAQLLIVEDPTELQQVHMSLLTLAKVNLLNFSKKFQHFHIENIFRVMLKVHLLVFLVKF